MPNTNDNLHNALRNKNDEFYTLLDDIERECDNYKKFFINKIIYLNCDDENSNFWKYFFNNFQELQLKELIATHLEEPKSYILKTQDGKTINKTPLLKNGSYDSEECLKLLDLSDIIITNPPFSKSKEFISLIIEHNKQLLVIGNENAFSSTLIFPLLKNHKIWTGFNKVSSFLTPEGNLKNFGNICWFTNIPINKNIPFIECTKKYDPDIYLRYNNFEAINVDRVTDIPKDYDGIMGVPISFINKWNRDQFELLGLAAGNTKTNNLNFSVPYAPHPLDRGGCGIVNNNIRKYTRVFIKKNINN